MEIPQNGQEGEASFPADDYLDELDATPAEPGEQSYLAAPPSEQPQAYDGMPYALTERSINRTSEPGRSTHKWQVPVGEVDEDERDRRVLKDPMERILEACGKYPPLPNSRTRELVVRKEEGDLDAKEQLVLHHTRLVVHMAKKYRRRGAVVGIPVEDLFQEGMLGLQRAVEKADLAKMQRTNSFSTYASELIRGNIIKGIYDRGDFIRLPAEIQGRIDSIKRTEARLTTQLGHEPTDEEIAEAMPFYPLKPVELQEEGKEDEAEGQYSEASIIRARRLYEQAAEEAVAEVKIYRTKRKHPLSIERLLEEDEDNPVFKDPEADPHEQATISIRNQDLRDLMGNLNDRERRILELRTGMRDDGDNEAGRTLEQVGPVFNVTKERIRQIENQSYIKLQSMPDRRKLMDTGDDPAKPISESYRLQLQEIHRDDAARMVQRFRAGRSFERPPERKQKEPRLKNPLGYPDVILQTYGPEAARLSRWVLLTLDGNSEGSRDAKQPRFRTVTQMDLRRLADTYKLNRAAIDWITQQLDNNGYLSRIVDETSKDMVSYPTQLTRDYLVRDAEIR